MQDQFARTELLIGKEAIKRLKTARVAIFGLGGVGGSAVEALVRSGIGALDIVDNDRVCLSNLNRQLLATHKTLGEYKVNVAKERILDINPDCKVTVYNVFYTPENAQSFDFSKYDYIVDAIDTVSGKIELVVQANAASTPIISAMGAGNKMDATSFMVGDIASTSVCPLAKVMRKELKNRGINRLKVVYSTEKPVKTISEKAQSDRTKILGSNAFVPPVVGLIMAAEVVKDLIGYENK